MGEGPTGLSGNHRNDRAKQPRFERENQLRQEAIQQARESWVALLPGMPPQQASPRLREGAGMAPAGRRKLLSWPQEMLAHWR